MTQGLAQFEQQDIPALIRGMGERARTAARIMARASTHAKNQALIIAAALMRQRMNVILTANAEDISNARAKSDGRMTQAMLERLMLDPKRVEGIARGLEAVAALPDPVGNVIASWTQPNGMRIERVRTPLGVIGVIYESRPNVTADAGALAMKAGNAVILRGGSESYHSSNAIHDCLIGGLCAAGLPEDAIQLVPISDRAAVGEMLGLVGLIDVIVPRGGKSLIARVQAESRVPTFAHLDGNNHVYVHSAADADKARRLVMNSKMRRVSVCGAAETLLVDHALAANLLPILVQDLLAAGCELRGDATVQALDSRVRPATDEDWVTEYLDAIMAVRVVDGLNEAIVHIERYGSGHTDAIVTEDAHVARRFFDELDSAILLHNASTQFADGGEFGMGAEIGIATGRIHARGPVGLEQLCIFKYCVHGDGQIRP